MGKGEEIESLSVIVPKNPFARGKDVKHCLCALDVEKLMDWWPGTPHSPHRKADKVKAIQRALDWKRVAHIAAYLLQDEIIDAPDKIVQYFSEIYEPKKLESGREWPPKVSRVVSYQRSVYPSFSNVLVHVNGANLIGDKNKPGAASLRFDPSDNRSTDWCRSDQAVQQGPEEFFRGSSNNREGIVMTFRQSVVTLVFCVLSGIAVAASPEGSGGEAGKTSGAASSPMPAAMEKMVGAPCQEHSMAHDDHGHMLGCEKGKWHGLQTKQMRKGRACVFRCTRENGVEVCRGNGPQCDGVDPWGG